MESAELGSERELNSVSVCTVRCRLLFELYAICV